MTLAEKIAALRGERKLSQGDLAEKLDVSRLRAYLTVPAAHYSTLLFGAMVGITRGVLALILLAFTGRLCWKKWKNRMES